MNITSKTDALGWSWLISGFQDKKVPHDHLLPVVINNNKFALPDKYSTPTDETIEVLKRNIEANRVPRKVMIALATDDILQQILKSS